VPCRIEEDAEGHAWLVLALYRAKFPPSANQQGTVRPLRILPRSTESVHILTASAKTRSDLRPGHIMRPERGDSGSIEVAYGQA
jgi:hypothetical protein